MRKRGLIFIIIFSLFIFSNLTAADNAPNKNLNNKDNLQYFNSEPGDKVTYIPIEEAVTEDEIPTPECNSALCHTISFDLPLKIDSALHSAHLVSDAKFAEEHQKVLTELSMEHFALLDDVSNGKVNDQEFKAKNEELIQSKQEEINTLQDIKKENPEAVDSSALQIETSVANAVKDVETQAGVEIPEAQTGNEGGTSTPGTSEGAPTSSEPAEPTPYVNSEVTQPETAVSPNENPTEVANPNPENKPDMTTTVSPENPSENIQTTPEESTQSSPETSGVNSESTQASSSESNTNPATENPTEETQATETTSQSDQTTSSEPSSDTTTVTASDSDSGGDSGGSNSDSGTGAVIFDFLKIKSKDSNVNKLARLERQYRNNLKIDMKLVQISNKTANPEREEQFDNNSIPVSFRLDDITFEFTQIGILKNALNLTRKYNITMDLAVISLPFEVNGNPKAFKIFEENQDVFEIVAHGLTHYNPVDLSHEGEFYDITVKKNIPPRVQEDHIRKMRSIFKRHGIDDADDVFALPYSAGDENTITLSENNNYKMITQWVVPNDRFVYSDGNVIVSRMIIGIPLQIKLSDQYYKDYQHELTNLLKLKQPIEIVLHPINLDQLESMEKIVEITKNVTGIKFHKIKEVASQQIVCGAPYIRNGTSCCLDKNNNGVCDSDEVEKINKTFEIGPQTNETQKPKAKTIKPVADKCSLTNELKCVDYKNNSNIIQIDLLNLIDSDITSVVAEVKDCGISNKLDLRNGESKNFSIVCSTGSRFNYNRELSVSYIVVNTGLSYYKVGVLKEIRK